MPAHLWELRADVRALELGAQRWDEISALVARRGDELVAAARRATDGWDAAAAESYEAHRRQVLVNLDRFTSLAREVAGSLRAVSSVLTSSQKQLDQAWLSVATVPHDVVGESRHLVFRPTTDDDRATVTRAEAEAVEIRRRLTLSLDQEGTRLRSARGELTSVRTELTTLTGGTFTDGVFGGGLSGVGTLEPSSTSVRGSAQSGVAALPPIAPISVSMPHLTGLSAAGLAPLAAAATAAGGLAGGRDSRRTTSATPPMGGMAAGAAGARGGTMSRGMASGRSGPQRLATPRMPGADDDDERSRSVRDREAARQAAKDAEKEAKRAALAEKRAERAARRAGRRAEKGEGPGSAGETDAEDRAPRR